jgi:hypothetical protein
MKAFLLSLVAMVVLTAVAAFGLQVVSVPSSDLYSESGNVRLSPQDSSIADKRS